MNNRTGNAPELTAQSGSLAPPVSLQAGTDPQILEVTILTSPSHPVDARWILR